ncbi:MAG: SRPBCC family protein [Muribaculaceae bacterium]
MAEFKSDVVNINADVSTVYAKLSHPELLQGLADQLPAEAKTKIENISFSEDTISVTANPVGEIKLSIVERIEPTLVKLSAVSSPIPFMVSIHLEDAGENATRAFAQIDVELNPFLKPMVQGPLTEAAKKFGELLTVIPYNSI